MIDDILLVNSFKSDKKLRIPESYLENHYTKFLVEHFQGNRSNYLEFLNAEGKTDREIREQQKEEVIIGFVRGRMRRSENTISPAQIQKYYDENKAQFTQKEEIHLRQIVIKNEKTTPNNENITLLPIDENITCESCESSPPLPQPNKTQTIVEQLKQKRPFAEIAKEFTEDGMNNSGGDLGWVNRSDLREELAKVAFSLNKHEFSDPIVLNNHTFILFVEDKKLPGLIPLPDVSEEIEKILANNYAKQAEAQFVQKLRKKAHIRYYL